MYLPPAVIIILVLAFMAISYNKRDSKQTGTSDEYQESYYDFLKRNQSS